MNFKIAILAGGLATRLHPLTLDLPKSLVPIHGYPFLGWQLRLLANSGVSSVVLCLGYRALDVVRFVGSGDQFGLKVEYSIEKSPLGTGGALKNAEGMLGDVFGVLYGDSYLKIDYQKMFDVHSGSNTLASMTIYKNTNKFERSNVLFQPDGKLFYSKKQPLPQMNYIDYGFSIVNKEALFHLPVETASDLSDVYETLSQAGHIKGIEIRSRFYEVGSFAGIIEFEDYLRRVLE